jgi:hypothetical protein
VTYRDHESDHLATHLNGLAHRGTRSDTVARSPPRQRRGPGATAKQPT